ncbi:MAG: carboxypeptidase regulatory-like domain-containing protein [Terriglobales bacterium]
MSGQVMDPTGAVIPNASVVLSSSSGRATATSDGVGRFHFGSIQPGSYSLSVAAKNFSNFSGRVTVVAGKPVTVNPTLKVQIQEEKVEVNAHENSLDVAPENNASALVLKGKDLDALSDDPDELLSELQALAGPSAGPNGGEVYVDGFSGGDLPPKSSIREIRINQNPFSAEYDKLGYGRIEIFTKPGTDHFHGQLAFMNSNSVLNARNPFASTKPDYNTNQLMGNFGGPISKRSSFQLNFERRDIGDQDIINALVLDPNLVPSALNQVIADPKVRTNTGLRMDFQLGTNDTLVARYQFLDQSEQNAGINTLSLPTQAYSSHSDSHMLQLTETHVFNPKIINETRFQFARSESDQNAINGDPTLNVIGAFTGGGNALGSNETVQDRYELQNSTSIVAGKHSVKFGGRLRESGESTSSTQGFNGTYTFASLAAYQATLQGEASGWTPAQIRAAGGGASQYSVSSGLGHYATNYADLGAYIQDDWKLRPNMVLSSGLRYETQNAIGDHGDFAPRFGFSWGLGGARPKTIIRAGAGIFYDRFAQGDLMTLERLNGVTQQSFTVADPDFFPNAPPPSALVGASTAPITYRLDPNFKSPYVAQIALSVERQVTKRSTVTVSYLHSHAERQLIAENINAPLPGTFDPNDPASGVRPLGGVGNIFQFESRGKYEQNQLIVNFNVRPTARISLFGFYTLGFVNSNTTGPGAFPSNPYDLDQDWGRASYDVRNRLTIGGNITLPYGIGLSPLLIASSDRPFNISLGEDLNGDSVFNDRPAFAAPVGANVATPFGDFDTDPGFGSAIIPAYYGSGPAQFTMNLRVSKSFGFGDLTHGRPSPGPEAAGPPAGGDDGPAPRPGPGPFGTGGGGRGGRGGRGSREQSSSEGARRYNLTFSAQVHNIFNTVNLANPIGDLESPLFGHSIALAGGPFNSSTANRRISLEVAFHF